MADKLFDLGRLSLLGLIALIILAAACHFLLGDVKGLFTSYQDERLQIIDAQADADAAAARLTEALGELEVLRGVREVLKAAAYTVRVDATTTGFWAVVGPIATATLLGMIVIAVAACVLARLGVMERLGAWIGAREAQAEEDGEDE